MQICCLAHPETVLGSVLAPTAVTVTTIYAIFLQSAGLPLTCETFSFKDNARMEYKLIALQYPKLAWS